ncbi:MAG: hypothetical protein F4Z55_03295 [Boseongicola sp. SB0667_bin_21]|nr:hypothetical protein [Boseongicola sp. SB0667_bin_21]
MKRLQQEAASALVECINSVTGLAKAEAEHIRKGGEPNHSQRHFVNLGNECIERVQAFNQESGYTDVLRELRDEFIEEELDALRDSLEGPERKELESEIRELSA